MDIETTGASPGDSRILEVGAIRVEDNRVTGTFNTLIQPECRIPAFITAMTGIDSRMVHESPRFADVAGAFKEFVDGALFIAHHVNFDYGFIRQEFIRLGQAWNMDRMCTVRLSRALFPAERRHSLNHLIERQGYTVAHRHRAYDDAEVLYKFYKDSLAAHGIGLYAIMDRLVVKTRFS